MSKSQGRAASRQTQSGHTKRSLPTATKRGAATTATSRPSASRGGTAVAARPAAKPAPAKRPAAAAKPTAKPSAAKPVAAPAAAKAPVRPSPVAARTVPTKVGAVRPVEVLAAPAATTPDAIWKAYRSACDRSDDVRAKDLRNKLIERYYEVVRFTAERMHTRLPNEVDVNDLISAGLFGLMDAIDAFDPGRGVKFETYCAPRIRGAIFDELRSMDWVPRLVRSRTAKVEKVRREMELETGRRPTDAEVADRMNVPASEFEKLQKDSRPVGVVSLDRKCFETDSSRDVREVDVIEDARQFDPSDIVQRGDLQTLITKGLTRAERLIVILYYYEEMTMKEIGLTLDLSESRVSQMHSSILARLKAQMQHRLKDF